MNLLPWVLLVSVPGVCVLAADEPDVAAPRHRTSPVITEAIRASVPKFVPKVAASAPAADRDEPAPEPSADGALLLPDYVVREKLLPDFSEFEMLTPKGRAELAIKRYPGLRFGPFAKLNIGIGIAMLREEQRLQDLRRAQEEADLGSLKGPAEAKALRKIMYDTIVRSRPED